MRVIFNNNNWLVSCHTPPATRDACRAMITMRSTFQIRGTCFQKRSASTFSPLQRLTPPLNTEFFPAEFLNHPFDTWRQCWKSNSTSLPGGLCYKLHTRIHTTMSSSKRRVSYYYDSKSKKITTWLGNILMQLYQGDVGLFSYGLGHPMKPHRMRMTHDLVSAYGMLDKMHVLRPRRATPENITAFHTDESIHFLSRVTPETAEELTYHGTRCKFLHSDNGSKLKVVH